MKSDTEIAICGSGVVTPFDMGSAHEILRKPALVQAKIDCDYWAVPDEFRARIDGLTNEIKRDRASWIAAGALMAACADRGSSCQYSGTDLSAYASERIGLVIGCAFAGQLGMIEFADEVRTQSARFVSPIHFPQTVGNYVAGAMARAFKIRGPNLTVAAGEISGLQAIATGCDLLSEGSADIVIAGGVEALSEALVRGLGGSTYGSEHSDSEHSTGSGHSASRGNSGLLAEGACFHILKRASDAPDATVTITSWVTEGGASDGGESGGGDSGGDTFSAACSVGRSMAAESAMRMAIATFSDKGAHHVVQTCRTKENTECHTVALGAMIR